MTNEKQLSGTPIWISDRNMDSIHLAQEVDGDAHAGIQMRRVFENYFDTIGGAHDLTTHQQADEWARQLRADGNFPEPMMPGLREERGHSVIVQLHKPHALGMLALVHGYVAATSPDFSELVALRWKQLDKKSDAETSPLDRLARDCIDDEKIREGYNRVLSWFSAAAISSYFDVRSQESNFVASMRGIAEEQRKEMRKEVFPLFPALALRPWEAAR